MRSYKLVSCEKCRLEYHQHEQAETCDGAAHLPEVYAEVPGEEPRHEGVGASSDARLLIYVLRMPHYRVIGDVLPLGYLLADESLAIEETADGYHWKASAIGRIGQVNGPLNSLSKAKPMRALCEKVQNGFNADMSDCWYVLGLLYNQLPGSPLSFGNKNYAISYMRRCVDTQDNVNRLNLTNYLELAQQLADRNWSADKRAKEFDKMKAEYDENTVPTEKMKFYEGQNGRNGQPFYSTLPIGQFSDAQEAVMVAQYALAVYGLRENPLPSDTAKAEEIQSFLDGILK